MASVALLVGACGGGGGGRAETAASASAGSASPGSAVPDAGAPVCAPLHQFLLAGRLLGQQLQGLDPRQPAYVQRVLDTGVGALQQVKPAAPAPRSSDADVQLRYWTAVRTTLAGDGYDVSKVSKMQDDALGMTAARLGSAGAADRLQTYAVTTCGQTVLPTAQQLQDF